MMLGNILINEKLQEKYLADILDRHGLSDSIEATIKAREPKTKGAIYEL